MPNPKSAVRFPKTQLFQRAAAEEAAKHVAPQPGCANEIPEDPPDASNELTKTAAAEESAKYVATGLTRESVNTTECPEPIARSRPTIARMARRIWVEMDLAFQSQSQSQKQK